MKYYRVMDIIDYALLLLINLEERRFCVTLYI